MSPVLRLVLPALAVATTAYAACSASPTATIENTGDASAIATCKTFSGSIAIATGVSDDIVLDGVEEIDGDLTAADNDQLKRISSSSLETIKGSLTLDTLQQLSNVNFPKLKKVESIKWNALANLQSLGFDAQINEADTVDIENTQLQSLEGLNLTTVKRIKMANNGYINQVDMQITNVTESLDLSDNNPEVNISFPHLLSASNLTFRAVGAIVVPSLETLQGSLGIYNSTLKEFAAPNLTEIGAALALVGNTNLANASFPKLTDVTGNVQIAENKELHEIEGFPELKNVGGALDLSGNITKIDLPSINDVKGTFNLQSTGDIDDTCKNVFQPLHDKNKLKGNKFVCKGEVDNPGTAGSTPTGSKTKETGAASALNAHNGALGFAGLAAVFLL